MRTRRLRSLLSVLVGGAFFFSVLPAVGQTAQSIAEQMQARHQKQLESVENYVIETNMYTSYHRKIMKDGAPAIETAVETKNQESFFFGMNTPPTASPTKPAYYDEITRATYTGSETVNGVECHILRVKNPSDIHNTAEQVTYYVDAEQYVPRRLQMVIPSERPGEKPTELVLDLRDYRSVKGLTVPWRITMQMTMNLSEEQRQQMKKMIEQMEKLPESQRKMMEQQMPFSFDRMKQMMMGESTTTIEVQEVRVNEGIPEGVFDSSSEGR